MIKWFSIIKALTLQQILAGTPQHGAHTWQYLCLKKNVFWDVMSCSLPAHGHFGRTYCLHFLSKLISEIPQILWNLKDN